MSAISIARSTLPWLKLPAIAALIVLVGCSGPPPAASRDPEPSDAEPRTSAASDRGVSVVPAEGEEPADGDWIVSRIASEPNHLNIYLDTSDAYASQMTRDVFEGMLEYDKETLELEPVLAESYEVSDDRLVYTFTLRDDIRFSDGVAITAHDVAFTVSAIQDPANETADIRNYLQDIEQVEVLDERTIRFTCVRPYFKHLAMIGGLAVYPRHIYGEGDFNTHPNNRAPVGSGPYMFERWDTNQQISFVRNENYWNKDEMPRILRHVYKVISDDSAAFQVLERQELDLMGMTPEQWVNRASRPEFTDKFDKYTYWATTGYVGSYSYIAWNMRKPMFSDKRVRRALTMLLDRDLILEEIYYGLGKVVSGGASSFSEEYDDTIEPWPFDPVQAAALLDEAGWVDSNNDGIRDKDGIAFRFEYLMPSGSREGEQLATVYKEELARAGIDMTIRKLEWAAFITNLTKREFDACSLGWAIPVDQDPYQVWHSSQTEQGSNYPGFSHPEVDQILEDARLEFDRDKRNALYKRWHAILHEEQPYTFLFHMQRLVAVDKRYRDVRVYPQGFAQREWWVPAHLQRY